MSTITNSRWGKVDLDSRALNEVMADIETVQQRVVRHKMYQRLDSLENIRIFMEHHVFAVLDFMWLLKRLQNDLTCTDVLWRPVGQASTRRFINEIVVGEESDEIDGIPTSHFELYLRAMEQVGADSGPILALLAGLQNGDSVERAIRSCGASEASQDFVLTTWSFVSSGTTAEAAGAFAFGREKLIPEMFVSIRTLAERTPDRLSGLLTYLDRHIDIDGEEHTPLAFAMVSSLCGSSQSQWQSVSQASNRSISARAALWDAVLDRIELSSRPVPSQGVQPTAEAGDEARCDVAIIGGGLGGLTLGIQLLIRDPSLSVHVMERAAHPAPIAAFKVGESTTENGAYYLSQTLGLRDLLEQTQLRKMGLRYFFNDSGKPLRSIEEYAELGSSMHNHANTYQLDRGLLENQLASRFIELGGKFTDRTRVRDIELNEADADHRVTYLRDGVQDTTAARWVVDASGRRGFLKRQLGLSETNNHAVNAVWFRIDARLQVDSFGSPDWQQTVEGCERWTSTVHFMGLGYWVWVIPLSTGATSFGVVYDPTLVEDSALTNFQSTMEWIAAEHPVLGNWVRAHSGQLLDFELLRNFSYGATQVFSEHRWGLIGEAGVFIDPLYSPGTDFIAYGNSLVTDMIERDRRNGSVDVEHAVWANRTFLNTYRSALATWIGQYETMGNGLVYSIKGYWDTITYFSMIMLRFRNNGSLDPALSLAHREVWAAYQTLNHEVQALFPTWATTLRRTGSQAHRIGGFTTMSSPFIRGMNLWVDRPIEPDQLAGQLAVHLGYLEALAARIRDLAAGSDMTVPTMSIDDPERRCGAVFPSEWLDDFDRILMSLGITSVAAQLVA